MLSGKTEFSVFFRRFDVCECKAILKPAGCNEKYINDIKPLLELRELDTNCLKNSHSFPVAKQNN